MQTMIESVLRDTTTLAPLMIFPDDYHLAKSQAVDKAISFLVDHLPPHMHLVMITR
ncbi:hypothetical protein [Paenibacillus illinoisensis]|uniref:hypothetical protein n=1 Tax=Paenibacillus illinoisensis TaxID=59845 RepID=UPI003D990452